MANDSPRMSFDALRSLASGSIGANFAAVGSQVEFPIRLIKLVNQTNQDVIFSTDGSTDHDFVPANSFSLYDISTNRTVKESAFLPAKTTLYVKHNGSAPTSGGVYITVIGVNI